MSPDWLEVLPTLGVALALLIPYVVLLFVGRHGKAPPRE